VFSQVTSLTKDLQFDSVMEVLSVLIICLPASNATNFSVSVDMMDVELLDKVLGPGASLAEEDIELGRLPAIVPKNL